MNGLTVLRALTAASVVALTFALVQLLRRRTELSARARVAWMAVAAVELLMVVGYLQAEVLAVLAAARPESTGLLAARRALYNPAYYTNAVLIAALPALLLRALSSSVRVRAAGTALLVVIAIAGAAGFASGGVASWQSMLSWTRGFTIVGITGYAVVWVLVAAERMPAMDIYLAAFLLMRTLYEIVKPVQELFFQAMTAEEAARIWHLHLFLQLLQRIGMIGAVWLLLGALRTGRPPRSVLAPKLSTLRH